MTKLRMTEVKVPLTQTEIQVVLESLRLVGWPALPIDHEQRKAYQSLLTKLESVFVVDLSPP